MVNIEAVLFDLGNTLIYFNGEWPVVLAGARQAALEALRRVGLHVARAPFLSRFQATLENNYTRRADDLIERNTARLLRDVLDELGHCDVPEHWIDAARYAFYAVTQNHWWPEVDALPTLKTLHEQGYRMGILSNAADDWDVQTLVDKAQVRPYMDFVLSSAALGQRKPSPAVFRAALAQWGISPARVAMVGDTLNADILGANHAGMCSVWITRRVNMAPEQENIHPQKMIHTLDELPLLLPTL